MTKRVADNAVLTGSIRRILFGVVAVGCLLAALQTVAVSKLQQEIDKWAQTSVVNGLREQLFARTNSFLTDSSGVSKDEIIPSFEELRRTILSEQQTADQQSYIADVLLLESEARDFFSQAEQQRAENIPLRQDTLDYIDALQRLSGSWSAQLLSEERSLLLQSNEIDDRIRNIAELRSTLTAALLAAQLLQQQIIAVERLAQTASLEIAESSIAALTISGLPGVCAANEQETDGRLCSPSVGRVLSSLDQLKRGHQNEILANVRGALRGLEGYVRAGQGRLQSLSEQSAAALDEGRAVRDQLTQLKALAASLGRVNRVLLDLKLIVERSDMNLQSLNLADKQLRSFISQIPFRMTGVLRLYPDLQGDAGMITANVDAISANWDTIHDNTAARLQLLSDFSDTMATLSTRIEAQAALVRNEATLWVRVYVSTFLFLAALFVASIIGAIWLAKRRLITPLAQVTGTIIALAKGQLDRTVTLDERAFGFDRLGAALEQLRMEMSERQTLMEHNRQQQALIEANLSDLERTNQEMEWLALHDPLTGLPNRRNADMHLAKLSKSTAPSDADFCIMQIDIDRFKSVNDALGHAAGDFVLKQVSGILMDNVAPDARCYRTGGDEFLVIWPGGFTEDDARLKAGELIDQIRKPMDFDGHRCNVGASIGIAFGHDTDGDAMQAVMNADLALYNVKKKGRDGFELFTCALSDLATRRKDISDRLLVAIDTKSFQPFYQPQFDARTRALRGVEVLCRWHADDLGWISPAEFLPVAEDLGVVGMIDEILFEKAALHLRALADRGLSIPRISFNITADRLLKSNLAQELSAQIGPYSQIALELLESMSLDNPTESVSWALDNLREYGIEIEIDDFGSDRASLAGLMAISPKAMKIDRSIVIPIVESERHKDLMKKILDIGAALHIEVVAEGVETEEHAALLSMHGCDVLQGFGLAKPMPFEQLMTFCAEQAQNPHGTYAAV